VGAQPKGDLWDALMGNRSKVRGTHPTSLRYASRTVSSIGKQTRRTQYKDIPGSHPFRFRFNRCSKVEKLVVVNQQQFPWLQNFIKNRLLFFSQVQMRLPAYNISSIDRENPDKISTVSVNSFRCGVSEIVRRTSRPDLMDADFSFRVNFARIEKSKNHLFEIIEGN